MLITVLKSKIHNAIVTESNLDYDGSCKIDLHLLNKAGIQGFEQIQIYNLTNGKRFTTYAVPGEKFSGEIFVMGAAAHKASVGDKLIICAYGQILISHEEPSPKIIHLDADNSITLV